MTDEEMVIAQGQENQARQDLSYIEKARFAQRLETRFDRDTIMQAMVGLQKRPVQYARGCAPRFRRNQRCNRTGAQDRPACLDRARRPFAQSEIARRRAQSRRRAGTAEDGQRRSFQSGFRCTQGRAPAVKSGSLDIHGRNKARQDSLQRKARDAHDRPRTVAGFLPSSC